MPEIRVDTLVICLQTLDDHLKAAKDPETQFFYEKALIDLCQTYTREFAQGRASIPLGDLVDYDFRERP